MISKGSLCYFQNHQNDYNGITHLKQENAGWFMFLFWIEQHTEHTREENKCYNNTQAAMSIYIQSIPSKITPNIIRTCSHSWNERMMADGHFLFHFEQQQRHNTREERSAKVKVLQQTLLTSAYHAPKLILPEVNYNKEIYNNLAKFMQIIDSDTEHACSHFHSC